LLPSTFQLIPGVGPGRERRLWRAGLACWNELADAPASTLSARTAPLLRSAVDRASAALDRRDVATLAALLPSSEHWRLFELFGDDAAYLDIETGDDVWGRESISAIGFLDGDGPRLLLAGRDLHHFPALARRWPMLVTFNGLSFDVPILRRAFPEWTPPAAHVDLRHALARLGHHGGLKAIERKLTSLNLARPAHLRGIAGWDACTLFRRGREGDLRALRLFAEYNLYDAVNLRTLMAHAYNELSQREVALAPALGRHVSPLPVPGRGDVLYDVSKILLAL
jgi:uncharacterized protein YprB with RNaseH-like and TPR domain